MNRHKVGPGREYEPGELQLYAAYRDNRAKVRPRACSGKRPCWVEQGPPALSGWKCGGCGAVPGGPGVRGRGERGLRYIR